MIFLILICSSIVMFLHGVNWFLFNDESVNLVNGWWMSRGLHPYQDYFSHHLPFPDIYSYFLALLGSQSHSQFRFGYVVTISIFFLLFSFYFKNKFNIGLLSGSLIFSFIH